MMDAAGVKAQLNAEAQRVEHYLAGCLDKADGMPAGLLKAMNYSLLAGGKRLRPVLCLSFARLFGIENAVLPFAAAIECIHSYSLIHDDLPAMDNDDMRRGKLSNHKQFGEASAILAGDALLTDAFAFMASCGQNLPPQRVLAAVSYMARAAGSPGMVGGQFLDMLYTERKSCTLEELRAMHAMKTGALLRASCVCGSLLAGADADSVALVEHYGDGLGAAFQIVDDILDIVGDAAVLGKPVGSDVACGKVTYPSLLGLEKSVVLAREEADKACAALASFGKQADFLRGLAEYVVQRVH